MSIPVVLKYGHSCAPTIWAYLWSENIGKPLVMKYGHNFGHKLWPFLGTMGIPVS